MRLVLTVLDDIHVHLRGPERLLSATKVNWRGTYLTALIGVRVVIVVQLTRKVEAHHRHLCAVKRRSRIVLKDRNERQRLTFGSERIAMSRLVMHGGVAVLLHPVLQRGGISVLILVPEERVVGGDDEGAHACLLGRRDAVRAVGVVRCPVHHALRYVEDYVADGVQRLLVVRPCPMKGTDGEKQQRQGTQCVAGR